MAVAAMCGMAPNANANIDNPAGAKAGEIYRWESNNPGEFEQKCKEDDGIIGLFTYAADGADWDSQFFIVFADAVVPSGTEVEISFQYRKSEDSGVVKFNAQGHADHTLTTMVGSHLSAPLHGRISQQPLPLLVRSVLLH